MANAKYDRKIVGKHGGGVVIIDVYRVLAAFKIDNPQMQHIIKKALALGERGHKTASEDIQDIIDSAREALKMLEDYEEINNG